MTISLETVAYANRNGADLLVDVYRPEGQAKAAVVFLHGGGWRRGSKEAVGPSAKALAGHGFVVLAAQYRLLGDAPWPAPIQGRQFGDPLGAPQCRQARFRCEQDRGRRTFRGRASGAAGCRLETCPRLLG
jgi:hypothetical protein